MSPSQKERYLELVQAKVVETTKQLQRVEQARNTAESKMTSRYDTQRENFNIEVNLHMDTLEALRQFQEFIERSGLAYKIEEGAVCSVYYFDSKEEVTDLLVAPVYVTLSDVRIVTPKSPLGKALMGKMLAGEFEYQVDRPTIRGIITDLQ